MAKNGCCLFELWTDISVEALLSGRHVQKQACRMA